MTVTLRRIDLDPPTAAQWAKAAVWLGSARPLVSGRSRRALALGIDPGTLSDAQLLALLSQEPALARRPLLISDHGAVSGFSAAAYERLAALG